VRHVRFSHETPRKGIVKKRNVLGLPSGMIRALKWIFVAIFLALIVVGVVGLFL
jgi:hypothetical protein